MDYGVRGIPEHQSTSQINVVLMHAAPVHLIQVLPYRHHDAGTVGLGAGTYHSLIQLQNE